MASFNGQIQGNKIGGLMTNDQPIPSTTPNETASRGAVGMRDGRISTTSLGVMGTAVPAYLMEANIRYGEVDPRHVTGVIIQGTRGQRSLYGTAYLIQDEIVYGRVAVRRLTARLSGGGGSAPAVPPRVFPMTHLPVNGR